MKCFPKSIGQCLTTVLVTSALLEIYALPLLSAPVEAESLDASISEANVEAAPEAGSAVQPEAVQPETVQPETVSEVAIPELEPVVEPPAHISEPLTEESPSAQPDAAIAPAPSKPIAEAAADKPVANRTDSDSTDGDSTAQESVDDPEASRLEAARQILAEKLAAIVARDQSTRETQLQQNLAAAALHYAQNGELEQARQIAHHPALPAEIQVEVLAEIETIAAQHSGQPQVPGQLQVAGQAVLGQSTSSPEQMQPYFSNARWGGQPASTTTWRHCPANSSASAQAESGSQTPKPATVPLQLGQQLVSNLPDITTAPPLLPEFQLTERSVGEKQFEFKLALRLDAAPESSAQAVSSVLPVSPPIATQSNFPSGVIVPETIAPQRLLIPTVSKQIVELAGEVKPSAVAAIEVGLKTEAIAKKLSLQAIALNPLPLALEVSGLPKGASKTALSNQNGVQVAATPSPSSDRAETGDCLTASGGSFMLRRLQQFGVQLPLPIPAVITSAFGWRIHPISGDRRFHAGVDIGAPMGTPVLAAHAGQVVVAHSMGGYGLTVVLEDGTSTQRNLYAHLSGIAVQPGAWVEAGTVIGWVGSTGNSTGPHLHFETRQRTAEGWIAVDPLGAELALPAETVARAEAR